MDGRHYRAGMTQLPADPEPFFPPRTPRRRWPWIVAAAVALAAIATGATLYLTRDTDPNAALKALAKHDPSGAEACYVLRQWLQGGLTDDATGQPENALLVSGAISETAAKSTTRAILATVGATTGAGLQFTNLRQLRDACVAAGADMPAYTDHP